MGLCGDRVVLDGDHMQFRVLLQTACYRNARLHDAQTMLITSSVAPPTNCTGNDILREELG